jgi:replication fork protection complex subunit Csm3/Swi3
MSDDVLGLDQPIKLTKRAKISKIDLEGLMDKQKGLPFIISSYRKPLRVIERNDQRLAAKLEKKDLTSSQRRRLKYDNEFQNLQAILQYYQFWCHGLLPKAKFRDCIYLLRSFGARDTSLKRYRKTLIEAEINKKKEELGLAVPSEQSPTTQDFSKTEQTTNQPDDFFSDEEFYAEAHAEPQDENLFVRPEVPHLEDIPNESYDAEMELLREMDS